MWPMGWGNGRRDTGNGGEEKGTGNGEQETEIVFVSFKSTSMNG